MKKKKTTLPVDTCRYPNRYIYIFYGKERNFVVRLIFYYIRKKRQVNLGRTGTIELGTYKTEKFNFVEKSMP